MFGLNYYFSDLIASSCLCLHLDVLAWKCSRSDYTAKCPFSVLFMQLAYSDNFGIFSVCAPQYVMQPPITEHASLHSKSLCKSMARARGGGRSANNMRPLNWWPQTEKILILFPPYFHERFCSDKAMMLSENLD